MKNKIKKIFSFFIVSLILVLTATILSGCLDGEIAPYSTAGESLTGNIQNTISVTGSGTVKVIPDEVFIDISVITERATTQDAVDENSKISERIISAIEKLNAENLTIETISFNLNPLYNYSQKNKPPRIYAYQVTSTVEVRTTDLEKIGEIIATATESGANDISSIGFDLTDDSKKTAINNALAEASKDADNKALAIANSTGLKIDRILYISESGTSYPGPLYSTFKTAEVDEEAAGVTPPSILPQEIEITASINIVYLFE
ncbi:MAG TPA: SIMPL domain-containing protein [Candidatus Hydromicrobium sp.]